MILAGLLLAACTSQGATQPPDSQAKEARSYSKSLRHLDDGQLSLKLPAGWHAQAWHVPDQKVESIQLSRDGSTLYWGRADGYAAEDIKHLAAMNIADGTVRFLSTGKPILAFSPFGGGVVQIVSDQATANSCGNPPCQKEEVQLIARDGHATTLTEGEARSQEMYFSYFTPFLDGVVYQLPSGARFDTYVLKADSGRAVKVRSDTVPAAALTVTGNQVVGQFYGRSGLWTTSLSPGRAVAALPKPMGLGTVPVGAPQGLAWGMERGDMGKQLVISAMHRGAFLSGLAVPSSDDYYNALWVDDCHLAEREADGFYYLSVCGGGSVIKQQLMSNQLARSLFNPARFDARDGRIAIAMSSSAGTGLDLMVLQPPGR